MWSIYLKYPNLSTYNFSNNSPISIIDNNGDSVYVVNSKGQVFNVTSINAKDIKETIGYNTLSQTISGTELLTKYETSTTNDIYITTGFVEGPTAQAISTNPQNAKKGNLYPTDPNSNFSGISMKNDADVTFITFNTKFINGEGIFENNNSQYEKASVLFHEIKHILILWAVQ